MAQNRVRNVPTFRAPSAYEEEMLRAQRQQQLAEMLRQQAFEPEAEPYTFQGFRATPTPANAIARVLSAYTAKKVGEKAEASERAAREADIAGAEEVLRGFGPQTRSVTGGALPETDVTGVASAYQPEMAQQPMMETVMPTAQERRDLLMQTMVRGTPTAKQLAQFLVAQEPKTAEYGTTPQYDAQGKAYVINKAGEIRYLDGITRPDGEAPTSFREFKLSQTTPGFKEFIESRTPKTTVDVRYGAPVAGVDAQGNPVFFQPNPTGGPPSVIEGVRPEGKAPTEGQSTARLYAQRMAQAEPMLQSPPPSFGSRFKENIPGGVGNVMLSPESRQFFQAERNFINAVLRKESGAVISDEEFANARRQYIPQPGDDPATLEQKRQNRELAIQEIGAAGGAGYKPPSIGASQVIDLPPRRR